VIANADYEINEAIIFLNQHSVEATFLVPTIVGLEKSIMDATAPVRDYLKSQNIHDFQEQGKGQANKVKVESFYITESSLVPTSASLYRPETKHGDPRIWFSKLNTYAKKNNLLAVISYEQKLYILNFSDRKITDSISQPGSPLQLLFKRIRSKNHLVADELLEKLRETAKKGWIKTVTPGDTGIGATLEHCLGIRINSSQQPDYKGIEIKARRVRNIRTPTRSTLFAQVPNWEKSALKSSAQILDNYGYLKNGLFRLNCSVSAKSPNSQGLLLRVDADEDELHECFFKLGVMKDVAVWDFSLLRNRLLNKHNETFWVAGSSKIIDNIEHFLYNKVKYTRAPFASNFHTLCETGIIQVDHLIKRDSHGVRERGPLFKISPNNLDLLFPKPLVFELI
jgi:hypothetical protein